MARPREFDPDQALQVAIDVFWEKGYFDASVDEVVRRSGVAKYGIYGTFGTKEELFEKALKQYSKDRVSGFQAILLQDDAALPELRTFFDTVAEMAASQEDRRGCLLCNTAMVANSISPEIQAIVQKWLAGLNRAFRKCLKGAVNKKQLDESMDSESIAGYLTNTFRTVLMLARSGESRHSIRQHVSVALRILE
jgi:TetR/AcrR family transcriptional repressor of nem operon